MDIYIYIHIYVFVHILVWIWRYGDKLRSVYDTVYRSERSAALSETQIHAGGVMKAKAHLRSGFPPVFFPSLLRSSSLYSVYTPIRIAQWCPIFNDDIFPFLMDQTGNLPSIPNYLCPSDAELPTQLVGCDCRPVNQSGCFGPSVSSRWLPDRGTGVTCSFLRGKFTEFCFSVGNHSSVLSSARRRRKAARAHPQRRYQVQGQFSGPLVSAGTAALISCRQD